MRVRRAYRTLRPPQSAASSDSGLGFDLHGQWTDPILRLVAPLTLQSAAGAHAGARTRTVECAQESLGRLLEAEVAPRAERVCA